MAVPSMNGEASAAKRTSIVIEEPGATSRNSVARSLSQLSRESLPEWRDQRRIEDRDDSRSLEGTRPSPRAVRVAAPRPLTWVDVAALIINKQVGSGIFVNPYSVVLATGNKSVAILFWVLGFLYTIVNMVLYLEYARDLPYTGGELVYLDHCTPKPQLLAYTMYGFYFAWLYNSAENSMQFGRQVLIAVSRSNLDYNNLDMNAVRFLAFCISTFVCLMLYFSTAKSQLMNKATAFVKILILLAIVAAGGFYIRKHGAATDVTTSTGIDDWTGAFLSVLFAYHGWENATYITGEIGHYRTLRNGFIVGVVVVGVFYILIATLYCFAFPLPIAQLPADYTAIFFGGGDKADMASAILVCLSTTGSMISVAYTCVRVKETMGWVGVLPWSSIWRRSAPVRASQTWRDEREYAEHDEQQHEPPGEPSGETPNGQLNGHIGMQPNGRPHEPVPNGHLNASVSVAGDETPVISKGTPEGGILLHWIVSTFYVIISIGIHPAELAIGFSGPLLVYGHFFVSASLALLFPLYKRPPTSNCSAPDWNAPRPFKIIERLSGRLTLAFVAFAFSMIIIVCVPIEGSQRYNLWVMIGVMGYSIIHWFLFVHPPTAIPVYKFFGFEMTTRVHGIHDRNKYDRLCDFCHQYERFPHRHAQEGYLSYISPSVVRRNKRARLLYRFFGGSNREDYLDIRLDNYYNLRIRPRWLRNRHTFGMDDLEPVSS